VSLHPDIERAALLGWQMVPATPSKKGMFKGYIDAATSDLDQLAAWSVEYPSCCWKCVPAGSGVWFLDADVLGADHATDGVAALRDLCALNGPLPPRPHGRSASGGHLLVFQDAGHPIAPGSARPAKGLDTLAGRCCAMLAPSRRKGRAYRWVTAPWDVSPPVAPEWLLAMLAPPPVVRPPPLFVATADRASRALLRSLDRLHAVKQGNRNAALNREAFIIGSYVAQGLLRPTEAERALSSAGVAMGLGTAEIRETVRSGLRAGAANPAGKS
jgi:hypothetical protein